MLNRIKGTARKLLAIGLFGAFRMFSRPTPWVWDFYYREFPDSHHIKTNGPRRFDEIAAVITEYAPHAVSMLDLGCHEGVAFHYLGKKCSIKRMFGIDCSEVALERARQLFDGEGQFKQFDLNDLYLDPSKALPVDKSFDVVLASEVLYYLGSPSYQIWQVADREIERKRKLIKAIARYSRGIVVFQHFGRRERDAIGIVIEDCGGTCVNAEWGIYCMAGTAAK